MKNKFKIPVIELRDVKCPDCDGSGEIDMGAPPPLEHFEDCDRCKATGKLEIRVNYCQTCGEELEWNDTEFGFDEESEKIYKCLTNKCDLRIKNKK